MLKRNAVMVSLLITCLFALGVLAAQAAPVGTFVQVEGAVDLLRGGQAPAVPAKIQGPVEVGDLVRTKSDSRAQIKFVDDTVLSIAPESGITIDEYMFDPATSNRKAVVGVLRGLVHTAVEKVNTKAEPDFIMKSQTAVLGVRGTRWYTKLLPTATDIYTEEAKLEVRNILPEIPGVQIVKSYQYCRVAMYLAPTVPIDITRENLKLLEKQMRFGIGASQNDPGPGLLASPNWPPLFPKYSGERSQVENLGSGFYVPPQITQHPQPPPPWSGVESSIPYHPSSPLSPGGSEGRFSPITGGTTSEPSGSSLGTGS
jgi:hypothetical protein